DRAPARRAAPHGGRVSVSEVRRLVADVPVEGTGRIAHATLDVVIGDDRALVSVALDATPPRVVCSCGAAGCAHAAQALLFLRQGAADVPLPSLASRDDAARSSPGTRTAPSVAPPLDETGPAHSQPSARPLGPPRHVAADALDDAITAIVR